MDNHGTRSHRSQMVIQNVKMKWFMTLIKLLHVVQNSSSSDLPIQISTINNHYWGIWLIAQTIYGLVGKQNLMLKQFISSGSRSGPNYSYLTKPKTLNSFDLRSMPLWDSCLCLLLFPRQSTTTAISKERTQSWNVVENRRWLTVKWDPTHELPA